MYTILYLVLAKLRHSSRSAVVWDSEKLTFASGLHLALSHAEGGHTTLLAAGRRTISQASTILPTFMTIRSRLA